MSELEVVNPVTGEVVDLSGMATDQLALLTEQIDEVAGELSMFRRAAVQQVCDRMDKELKREAVVGGYKLTVNAPTKEEVSLPALAVTLHRLEDDGVIAEDVVDRVIVTPEPKPVAPRVAKTELNKLLKHPDPQVVEALREAIDVVPQHRTLRVERVG